MSRVGDSQVDLAHCFPVRVIEEAAIGFQKKKRFIDTMKARRLDRELALKLIGIDRTAEPALKPCDQYVWQLTLEEPVDAPVGEVRREPVFGCVGYGVVHDLVVADVELDRIEVSGALDVARFGNRKDSARRHDVSVTALTYIDACGFQVASRIEVCRQYLGAQLDIVETRWDGRLPHDYLFVVRQGWLLPTREMRRLGPS